MPSHGLESRDSLEKLLQNTCDSLESTPFLGSLLEKQTVPATSSTSPKAHFLPNLAGAVAATRGDDLKGCGGRNDTNETQRVRSG